MSGTRHFLHNYITNALFSARKFFKNFLNFFLKMLAISM